MAMLDTVDEIHFIQRYINSIFSTTVSIIIYRVFCWYFSSSGRFFSVFELNFHLSNVSKRGKNLRSILYIDLAPNYYQNIINWTWRKI